MPRSPAKISAVLLLAACGLAACEVTPQVNLAVYAPVIDRAGLDPEKYRTDIVECRQLGLTAQATYKEERDSEVGKTVLAGVIGAGLGAGAGALVTGGRGGGAAVGAIAGSAIGTAAAADNIDHTRKKAKLGPAEIVDRCMAGRGYTILSDQGFGGG